MLHSNDWGQKNIGAFCAKMFQDYFDYTQNKTFLATTAYPFLRLVGDFYESYATVDSYGTYSVMHRYVIVVASVHTLTTLR